MKLSPNAIELLKKRYCIKNEKPNEVYKRVASSLSKGNDKDHEKPFFRIMDENRFLPNSPCIANAGMNNQLKACFVLGVGDSMEEIFQAMKQAAQIFKSGGGVGYNFSNLRQKDAPLSARGTSSGVLSFMKIFDDMTDAIKQGGMRRGASMGILNYDHPEILDFITVKLKQKVLTNFNLSVMLDNQFMKSVETDEWIYLKDRMDKRKITQKIKAKDLFNVIVYSAWLTGDPGVLFYDRINEDNIYYPKYPIIATNPCVTGSTLIAVADGRGSVPISQLVSESKDVPVYCADESGYVHIRYGRDIRLTRENVIVYMITLDDGTSLKTTSDHEFILKNGKKKKVSQLLKGDSLMRFDKYQFSYGGKRSKYWGIQRACGNTFQEHRLISEFWLKRRLDKNEVVHHKDRNGLNNFFTNLEVMEKRDHNKLHSIDMLGDKNPMRRFPEKNIFNDKEWQDEIRKKHIGTKRTEETKRKIGDKIIERFQDPKFRQSHSEKAKIAHIENIDNYNRWFKKRALNKLKDCQSKTCLECFLEGNSVKVRKYCAYCGEEMILSWGHREKSYHQECWMKKLNVKGHSSGKYNISDENREKISERMTDNNPMRLEHNKLRMITNNPMFKEENVIRMIETRKKRQRDENHKVVSVTFVGCEDVYNMTVDNFHNYAVITNDEKDKKSGVIISNCGEQPLLPNESCCLGSINLNEHLTEDGDLDMDKFLETVDIGVEFLLQVNKYTEFPFPELYTMNSRTNRIGLGIMGFADMLIGMNVMYDSNEALKIVDKIFKPMLINAKKIAHNSASVLTIAPTGSLSILASCSPGIEPIYSSDYQRFLSFGTISEKREDSEYLRTAHEITPEWHLKVQAAFQKICDSGVSKTINLNSDASINEVYDVYWNAWKMGCKGITVYRDTSKDSQVFVKAKCTDESCYL